MVPEQLQVNYAPYSNDQINYILGQYAPSAYDVNSVHFKYWVRSLYNRAKSIFKWTVPDNWNGTTFDWFMDCLFYIGFVGVFNTDEYGYVFQPCSPKGYNIFYQPTEFLVANPIIQKTCTVGEDGDFLKMTADWRGAMDIIYKFADELANLDNSMRVGITNLKSPRILYGSTKAIRESLKKADDVINEGNSIVVLDEKMYRQDKGVKNLDVDPTDNRDPILDFKPLDIKGQSEGVINMLETRDTILKQFDQEIGIPTISEKKERLVTSEAETKVTDSKCKSIVWLECLQNSIDNIKEIFPDIQLSVELRYDEEVEDESLQADDTRDREDAE